MTCQTVSDYLCKDSRINLENDPNVYLPIMISLAINNDILKGTDVKRIVVNRTLHQTLIDTYGIKGVYIIRLPIKDKKHILYIGSSKNLYNRLCQHRPWVPNNCIIDIIEGVPYIEDFVVSQLVNKYIYGNLNVSDIIEKLKENDIERSFTEITNNVADDLICQTYTATELIKMAEDIKGYIDARTDDIVERHINTKVAYINARITEFNGMKSGKMTVFYEESFTVAKYSDNCFEIRSKDNVDIIPEYDISNVIQDNVDTITKIVIKETDNK